MTDNTTPRSTEGLKATYDRHGWGVFDPPESIDDLLEELLPKIRGWKHDDGVHALGIYAAIDYISSFFNHKQLEAQILILQEFLPGKDTDLEHYARVMAHRIESLEDELEQLTRRSQQLKREEK